MSSQGDGSAARKNYGELLYERGMRRKEEIKRLNDLVEEQLMNPIQQTQQLSQIINNNINCNINQSQTNRIEVEDLIRS